MKRRVVRLLTAVAAGLGLAALAEAHHSQSEFDFGKTVEVEGTVTKL